MIHTLRENQLLRLFIAVLALVGLSACTPTTTTIYPEHYTAANCFSGTYAFDLELNIPATYGRVLALTLHSSDSAGLRMVCCLVPGPNPTPIGEGYPIHTGEVDNGRDGLCVSARTSAGGQVLSCASACQVRRAMSAATGSRASAIMLSRWQPYGG